MTLTAPRPTDRNIDNQPRDAKGHVIAATPTKAIMEALNAALIRIRQRHPDVPNVVLVVGHSDTKRHGQFSSQRWDGKAPHEISLSGESLKRGAVPTLGTLIHETAHALAINTGVKDTSRQGRYHNAEFKRIAEGMGISLEKDNAIGWSITSVPESTQKAYRAELTQLRRALKTYRIPEMAATSTEKKNLKIACACRSVNVPIGFYKKGSITCDECGVTFEGSEDDLATLGLS